MFHPATGLFHPAAGLFHPRLICFIPPLFGFIPSLSCSMTAFFCAVTSFSSRILQEPLHLPAVIGAYPPFDEADESVGEAGEAHQPWRESRGG